MSYTPPAANALVFDWDGSLYTVTPGSALFSWDRGRALGINAAPTFGTPGLRLTQPVSGWQAAYFGNPGNTPLFAAPFTWVATTFGLAKVLNNEIGFQTGARGTPFGISYGATKSHETLDVGTGAPVLGGFATAASASHASTLAAYAAWAAELGVDPTDSLGGNATGSSNGSLVDLGFPPLQNSAETRMLFATRGVAFYRKSPEDTTIAARTMVGDSPGGQESQTIYCTASPPSLVINVKSATAGSGRVTASKWQKTADEAILYMRNDDGSGGYPLSLALRIGRGTLEVVAEREYATADTPRFLVYTTNQYGTMATYIGTSLAVSGGMASVLSTMGVYQFNARDDVLDWAFAAGSKVTRVGRPKVSGAVSDVRDLATNTKALGLFDGGLMDAASPSIGRVEHSYNTWAAEIGVDPYTSLSGGISGGSAHALLDLGLAPLEGGTETRIGVSSAGGVALYKGTIADTSAIDYPVGLALTPGQERLQRWFGTVSTPSLILSANRPAETSATEIADMFWQKAGAGEDAVAILRFDTAPVAAGGVTVAYRFTPGAVQVVAERVASSLQHWFQVTAFEQDDDGAGYFIEPNTEPVLSGGMSASIDISYPTAAYEWRSFIALTTVRATGSQFGNVGAPRAPHLVEVQPTGQQLAPTFGTPNARYAWGPPCVPDGIAPTVVFGTPRRSTLGVATGIAPTTQWGLPQRLLIARGFRSGGMGRPVATWSGIPNFPQTARAVAFDLTRFGLPFVPGMDVVGRATSLHATAFGLPRVDGVGEHLTATALAFEVTQVGTHRALRQTEHGAVFIAPGNFGTPTTKSYATATGAQTGQFGAARASRRQTQAGVALTAFGVSKARVSQTVAAWTPSTTFGAGKTLGTAHAPGFRATLFGTALAAAGQRAAGFAAARWGTPSTYRPNTYLAQGLNAGPRFGQPYTAPLQRATGLYVPARFGMPIAARERLGQRASGFVVGNFGTPSTHWRVHARHIAPSTTFGAPTISRSILC